MLYRMISTAGTGFFFVGEKSTKHATRKLALRKYDPLVNRYVLFTEQKLKKWSRSRFVIYDLKIDLITHSFNSEIN